MYLVLRKIVSFIVFKWGNMDTLGLTCCCENGKISHIEAG